MTKLSKYIFLALASSATRKVRARANQLRVEGLLLIHPVAEMQRVESDVTRSLKFLFSRLKKFLSVVPRASERARLLERDIGSGVAARAAFFFFAPRPKYENRNAGKNNSSCCASRDCWNFFSVQETSISRPLVRCSDNRH
jgi:hypothetical protein